MVGKMNYEISLIAIGKNLISDLQNINLIQYV